MQGVDVQRRTSELKAENVAFASEVRSLQRRLAEVRAQRQVSLGQLQRRPSPPPAGAAAAAAAEGRGIAGPSVGAGSTASSPAAARGAGGSASAPAGGLPAAGANGAGCGSPGCRGGGGSLGDAVGGGSPSGRRGGGGSAADVVGAGSPGGGNGAGSPSGGNGGGAAGWRALEEDTRRGRAALRRSASSDGVHFRGSPVVPASRPARPSSAGSADASARRALHLAAARSASSVELLRDENYFLTERLVEASVQHAQSFESFSNDRNTMWPLVQDLRRQVQEEQAQASQCRALLRSSQQELEALAEENLRLAERLSHRGRAAGPAAAPSFAAPDAADPRADARQQRELTELQQEFEAKDLECRQLRGFAARQAEQAEATIRDLATYGAELQARLAEAARLLELHGLLPRSGGSPAEAAAAAEAARAAAPRLAQALFEAPPPAAPRQQAPPPRQAPTPSLRSRASLIAPPAPRSPTALLVPRPNGAWRGDRHPPPPLTESEQLERSLQVKSAELDRLRRAAIAAVM